MLSVRRASAEDLDLLVSLGRKTFFDTFQGTCSEQDMQLFLDSMHHPAKIAAELADPDSHFYFLQKGSEVIGYSRLWRDPAPLDIVQGKNPIELVRFYLIQSAIGSGAATHLMSATLEMARLLGHDTAYLGVWEHNHRAKKFYTKWGFTHIGEHVFPVGNDPQLDHWLERPLANLPLSAATPPEARFVTRIATRADLPLLARMAKQTFYDTWKDTCSEQDMSDYLAQNFSLPSMVALLEESRSSFLLLDEVGQSLRGYAHLVDAPAPPEIILDKPLYLKRFYLKQKAQGSGAADTLMRACLDHAAQEGAGGIYLNVWERNFRAQRFYARYGFIKRAEIPYPLGAQVDTDWILDRPNDR
jgi:diamine N-acetyltransferase